MQWTPAHLAAALALACGGACGGDDGGEPDAGPGQDASLIDASSRDAAVVDCSGDHRESAEDTNDPFSSGNGSAERTGLTLDSGEGFWLCGQLDPGQASGDVADYDAYEFTVEAGDPVVLRVELVASDVGETPVELDLFRIEDGPVEEVATDVPFRNGYALLAGLVAQPGRYWVSAKARPPAPGAPLGYAIRVSEDLLTCAPAGPPVAYAEAADGDLSRGNDTVQIHLPDSRALTDDEMDAPEPTELVLEPDAALLVRGESDAVESAGDSYLDRDTFLLATGATTSELEVRLTWPDGMGDLDINLFAAGDPETAYSGLLGTQPGLKRDEVMTLNVDPGRDYWLWVGAYDGGGMQAMPVAYDITLCPRVHVAPVPPR